MQAVVVFGQVGWCGFSSELTKLFTADQNAIRPDMGSNWAPFLNGGLLQLARLLADNISGSLSRTENVRELGPRPCLVDSRINPVLFGMRRISASQETTRPLAALSKQIVLVRM